MLTAPPSSPPPPRFPLDGGGVLGCNHITTMKNEAIFPKIHCTGRDEKARRRLNVAPKTRANITAAELEEGVTLEALENIGAPVFRYATQVTIHGLLPDYSPPAFGYKFLTKNGNGSIGVKFAGIDAAKKRLIYQASRLSSELSGSLTSQGLTLQKTFYIRENDAEGAKAAAIAFALKLETEFSPLVYGEIYGMALPWGVGYAVALFIGAVPTENVAPICRALCGHDTAEAMEKSMEVRDVARRAELLRNLEECKAQRLAERARGIAENTLDASPAL